MTQQTVLAILMTGGLFAALLLLRLFVNSSAETSRAIVCNEDGSVRCLMNSPTLNNWKELVVVGAAVRTITMKREKPKVQVHVRGKYFVFLSGDGLLCTEKNPAAYDVFSTQEEWVITEVEGKYITLNKC
jgi:hypothetical protein